MGKRLTWLRAFTFLMKDADETVASDTSLNNDSDLAPRVEASKNYWFQFRVWYNTPTAADFKYDVNGPAGATLVQIKHKHMAPGAAVMTEGAIETAFAFASVSVLETAGTNGYIEIEGILQNGTTAGNVTFRWCQNTSNVSVTTVRAGSYVLIGEC